ncbi:hypothetical protein BT93_D1266 [Corymbia citriodora subsp. variegata]|nr:hypothetical protein BT93_D1266 [Corymbia citriodora subsp. variegata]
MAGRHWGSDDDRETDRHNIPDQIMDNHVLLQKPKQESLVAHGKVPIDPALNVFFTLDDLRVGKRMPIYFPSKSGDPSKSPRLLTREQSDSIPFSSAQLSHLLSFFSIPEGSSQAKAMEYTLKQCELEPIAGETRFCAASLESMLDSARELFGPKAQFRVLTTTYLPSKKKAGDDPLQNYTILQAPQQIDATRVIGCHTMPYPYAVFYCHSQAQSENRVYQISLGSGSREDGGVETSVEAVAVCHMDTTLWDRDHVSFRVLGVEPGRSPVCHFFPADNLVWVAS